MATGVLDNNADKTPEERIVEAISTCNRNTLYIDNNVTLFYSYDKDCENEDCEQCERKNYCGYYLNEMSHENNQEDARELDKKEDAENKNEEEHKIIKKNKKNKDESSEFITKKQNNYNKKYSPYHI